MTDNRTFQLISKLLGEDAMEYIARQRADERTWDWIARDLKTRVGVTYSREWIRRCYVAANPESADASQTPASAA